MTTTITNHQILSNLMAAEERVLLTGPPGCGKTDRIHEIAKENGRELIVVRAALSERPDFAGALVPDMEAGVTRALPLELFAYLKTVGHDVLLFADDLGQAPMDVQSALMKWFDKGELSPHVLIWGATNRPGDVAGVTRLCEPLRSRFGPKFAVAMPGVEDRPDGPVVLGTWEGEVAAWCDWAMDNGAPPEVIAWHRSTSGRTLYQWKPQPDPAVAMPDYRAWERVITLWNKDLRDLPTVSSVIGKPAAIEFLAFARLAHELPTPEQVWMDPQGAPVPDDKAALFLVASMLAAAADPKYATQLATYLARMPRVYGALLGRDVYKKLGPALSGSKAWVKWFTANQELFAVGN